MSADAENTPDKQQKRNRSQHQADMGKKYMRDIPGNKKCRDFRIGKDPETKQERKYRKMKQSLPNVA